MRAARPAGRFGFRRLRSADLRRLHRWLNTPHVLAWWDRPGPSVDDVRAKYLPRVAGPDGFAPYIIKYAGRAIGYIQLYRVPAGAWGLRGAGRGAGVDVFIGERGDLHRGLGPQILRQFLTAVVFRDPGVAACYIDPSSRNAAAVRAFEKAGFRRIARASDPESGKEVYIMRITRQELKSPARTSTCAARRGGRRLTAR